MTIKTQIKSTARNVRKATPVPTPDAAKRTPALHTLVMADKRAMITAGKAGVTEYSAFKAVIEAAPLTDKKALSVLQADIKNTFDDAHADAAQIRVTILNNAFKVVNGATMDKQVIKGKGMQAVMDVLASVTSIRELRKAMAAAKPEQLKDNRGGNTKPAKPAKPEAKAKGKQLQTGLIVSEDKHEAIQAAVKVLEFVVTNFLTMADDGSAMTSTYATIKLLKAVA